MVLLKYKTRAQSHWQWQCTYLSRRWHKRAASSHFPIAGKSFCSSDCLVPSFTSGEIQLGNRANTSVNAAMWTKDPTKKKKNLQKVHFPKETHCHWEEKPTKSTSSRSKILTFDQATRNVKRAIVLLTHGCFTLEFHWVSTVNKKHLSPLSVILLQKATSNVHSMFFHLIPWCWGSRPKPV